MLYKVLAHILVPCKSMHYHLLHTIFGSIWLVKVHIVGFFLAGSVPRWFALDFVAGVPSYPVLQLFKMLLLGKAVSCFVLSYSMWLIKPNVVLKHGHKLSAREM